jgi:hypothetical protein
MPRRERDRTASISSLGERGPQTIAIHSLSVRIKKPTVVEGHVGVPGGFMRGVQPCIKVCSTSHSDQRLSFFETAEQNKIDDVWRGEFGARRLTSSKPN